MAGDAAIVIVNAASSDHTTLIDLYASRHAQSAMPEPVPLGIVEETVYANLQLSERSPKDLIFLKAAIDGAAVGFALGRRRSDGRYSLEIVVNEDWLRRGIATALLIALDQRCHDQGATEVCGHVYRANAASIALFKRAGFEFAGAIEDGRILEFVKTLD